MAINIEVAGGRYVSFGDTDLHYATDVRLMESERNIVQHGENDRGSSVVVTAIKGSYSLIDLVTQSRVRDNTTPELTSELKRKLRDYNRDTYGKETQYLLIDSGFYRYRVKGSKHSPRHDFDNGTFKRLKVYTEDRGGTPQFKVGTALVYYPNVYRSSGNTICNGRAGLSGVHGGSMSAVTKTVLASFFSTKFNTDLTDYRDQTAKLLTDELAEYYLNRRIEQLGLEGGLKDLLIEYSRQNNQHTSTVQPAMLYFSIMGIDYINFEPRNIEEGV